MSRSSEEWKTAPFANLSLGTKGVLVVALPVCALLLAMAVFYQFQRQLRETENAVERTFEIRTDIRRVLTQMVNAETGLRGYLLTRREDFLQPYQEARQQLPQALRNLEARAGAEEGTRVASIQVLVGRVLDSLENSRQTAARESSAAVVAELETNKATMDDLRGQLAAMIDRERTVQQRESARAHRLEDELRGAIFAGGGFGLLGGILAALIFTTGIGRRVRHLEDEAREVAAGHTITHEAVGKDELARLERTMKETSERLARQSEELRAARNELEQRVRERTAELAAANEELREANEVREAVIHSSPLAIWAVDLDGKVTFWNPAAEEIFGWTESEVVGKPLPVVPPEHQEEYQRWVEGFRRGEMFAGVERQRVRKDGTRIDVAIWTAPLRDPGGNVRGTIAIDSDVSQRKLLEEQFRQAQKLEAVGRLAGGVAHDFNNLLTVIQGYTEMIVMEAEDLPNLLEYAQEIQYASTRASALTTQLLAFSRRQISQPKQLDLNEVVTHSMKLLRRVIGEDIDITTHLAPDLGKVKIDPLHIDQVIMNLAVNARDAMPNGGRLAIETANVRLDEEYTDRHICVAPGPYCMLAISDNGVGMTPETRSRLFEPFFTTKEPGKGTGLGLAIVYGIVKQNHGEIMVYSEPGRGTTFKIYLPMVEVPASFAAEDRRSREMRGDETILVCEDDAKIRTLVQNMLSRQGYRVLVAETPDEALATLRNGAPPIDLLLTDVVMPKTSGFELARAVAAIRPEVHVLYMSGYTDNQMSNSWVLESDVPFIQKPFTAASLTSKVREALSKPNGAGKETPHS